MGVAAVGVVVGLSMLLAPCPRSLLSEFTTNLLLLLTHGSLC